MPMDLNALLTRLITNRNEMENNHDAVDNENPQEA